MNIEKFCEGVRLLKGMDIQPNGFNADVTRKKIIAAIQNFFEDEPKKKINLKIQNNDAFGASTNLPRIAKESYDFIMNTAEYDNGWELAFKKVPIVNGSDSWEIHTGTSGLVLQQRAEGEKLDVKSVSGSKIDVHVYKYGLAIGLYDEFFRFRKISAMYDLLEEARNAYLIGKSSIFYNLIIAAAAGNVTSYQSQSGSSQVNKDILTINAGANAIGTRLKDKVPNASTGALIGYFNPNDEYRIEAAFRSTTVDNSTKAVNIVKRPINRIYTYNIPANTGILVWPGRKNQWAELLGLTQLTDNDILSWAYIQAYWTYFGGACADTDQLQTIQLA